MGKITVEVKINTFGTMTHPKVGSYLNYKKNISCLFPFYSFP